MIKEALQYITDLKEAAMSPKVLEINGRTYCDRRLNPYDKEPLAQPIQASTLTALVDYIKNCSGELRSGMICHVESPVKVSLYSGLTQERKRENLFVCNAIVPKFRFDSWYDQESFLIEMRADFVSAGDLETILKIAGNVQSGTTKNCVDDGVSQQTTIKSGVASRADVIAPSPACLTPYRTFLEVPQPDGLFVFRIGERNGEPSFKIVEAEGGLWRNQAMQYIKSYIEQQLEEIDMADSITIIA